MEFTLISLLRIYSLKWLCYTSVTKKDSLLSFLTLGRQRGVDATSIPRRFFQNFEKTIYSNGLKLSVGVPSLSAETLICHLRVHHI